MMKTKILGVAAAVVAAGFVLFTTCGLNLKEKSDGVDDRQPLCKFRSPSMPDSVFFMGEKVPLGRFDVSESLERELLVNTFFHSQTIRLLKLAPRFFSIIDPVLQEEGVPADFRYLAVAESNLDPKAYSPAGAVGLWQFMKPTAVLYGLEVNGEVDERYHIEKSTRAACRYLKDLYGRYRDWGLVAAAYNAGPGAVEKQMERQRVADYFDLLMNEETERYVFRIISLKLVMENPENYGFLVEENEKYPLLKTKNVSIKGAVADFAGYARELGITYKTLKYYNPWLRDILLTNKAGKSYTLQIPE